MLNKVTQLVTKRDKNSKLERMNDWKCNKNSISLFWWKEQVRNLHQQHFRTKSLNFPPFFLNWWSWLFIGLFNWLPTIVQRRDLPGPDPIKVKNYARFCFSKIFYLKFPHNFFCSLLSLNLSGFDCPSL